MLSIFDELIYEMYVSEQSLLILEQELSGHTDSSVWPFEFYNLIMDAADKFYDKRLEAINKLGDSEVNRQYELFKANCGNT